MRRYSSFSKDQLKVNKTNSEDYNISVADDFGDDSDSTNLSDYDKYISALNYDLVLFYDLKHGSAFVNCVLGKVEWLFAQLKNHDFTSKYIPDTISKGSVMLILQSILSDVKFLTKSTNIYDVLKNFAFIAAHKSKWGDEGKELILGQIRSELLAKPHYSDNDVDILMRLISCYN